MISLLQYIVAFIGYVISGIGKVLGYIPIVFNTFVQGFQFVQSMLEFIPPPLLGIASVTCMVGFSLVIIKIIKLVI